MPGAQLELGPPVQIAYAVADAEAAAADWARTVGAGPFFIRRHIPVTDVVYRGRPALFDHTSAYGQWGGLMIELVQDHTVGPSVLSERPVSRELSSRGVHHVACLVDDFSATLAGATAAGVEVAMTAVARTTPFAFLDTVSVLGHFTEIYPRTESIVAFYASVSQAAVGWNGADPVRVID
jgi:hypothetical protein